MATSIERHANALDVWDWSDPSTTPGGFIRPPLYADRTYRSSFNGFALNGISAFNEGMWFQRYTVTQFVNTSEFVGGFIGGVETLLPPTGIKNCAQPLGRIVNAPAVSNTVNAPADYNQCKD